MKLRKPTKKEFIGIFCFILLITNIFLIKEIYFLKIKYKESIQKNISNTIDTLVDPDAHVEIFDKYNCEFTDNTDYTECVINAADRASAEREWKQSKLESIKETEINTIQMLGYLGDEKKKIHNWKIGFEKVRDTWCIAKVSFITGSGTPSGIAECEIDFEIKAIKDLNDVYYDTIVRFYNGDVADFEPKESDIDKLIKTNKTSSECIWAGETDCK